MRPESAPRNLPKSVVPVPVALAVAVAADVDVDVDVAVDVAVAVAVDVAVDVAVAAPPLRRQRTPRTCLHGLLPGVALLLLLVPQRVSRADPTKDEAAILDRLGVREEILESQKAAADATTRERALLTYRLARRRELGFTTAPGRRLEDARSFDLSLRGLRRSFDEARTLGAELDGVRGERSAMDGAFVARALLASSGEGETVPHTSENATHTDEPHFLRPLRGTPVALPGARRDGPTKVELHYDSVQILARLNDPVQAAAPGVVKRVEALPQGGFAVTIAHAAGYTSILTGLRDIAVQPGDKVDAGKPVGLTGRNLDGAAVISVELWRDRRPVDAAKMLRVGRSTGPLTLR